MLHADNKKGTLFMLPVPVVQDALNTIPEQVKTLSCSFKYLFVENVRTARRYLKSIDKTVDIDAIHFSEVNTQTPADLTLLAQWLNAGFEVGMMSESGCPGVADPGSALVAKAHELGATVVPLVGPSSILLALMGSGFNGQSFRFVGYLPVKEPLRSRTIKDLESTSTSINETQIFIETPYRNNQLLQELLRHCKSKTKICVAANITDVNQFIKTRTVQSWKNELPELHKQPCIFLLQGN